MWLSSLEYIKTFSKANLNDPSNIQKIFKAIPAPAQVLCLQWPLLMSTPNSEYASGSPPKTHMQSCKHADKQNT